MRTKPPRELEAGRYQHPSCPATQRGDMFGFFILRHGSAKLRVMSSGSDIQQSAWEHVSISLEHRTPTWREMCFVKNLFWDETETVIQFHHKKSEYKNDMTHCLHLWKKVGVDHELPPQDHV